MRRTFAAPLLVVKVLAVGFAVALATPGYAPAAAATVQPLSTNDFRVATSSATHDVGTFARSATVIEFEAAAQSAVTAEVSLSVAGKKFTASKDIAKGVAKWSGGEASLQPDDRTALDAFAKSLESTWIKPANATKTPVPLHRDLTIRLAMLVAEAPVGTRIGSQEVPRPVERFGAKQLPEKAAGVESCLKEGASATAPNSASRSAVIAACQESNEDGILYTGCNQNAWVVHDADSHCFLGESIYVGPASYDCMGKCGGGCFIITGYTYDCADHDRCGRQHGGSTNPWDSECGDEYFEADDDFLWSSNQCG
ncbi:hypothetical protein [Micromonospora parathelypteridis]|uniref:Uncharacterized protein n=1 Tax=Micromonospora parathelypteridis TaxID=1839617 RepID=A0A840VTL1_9ACTN|nr:hypothetical protein [Micromonospora parathelypteridis]MBB5480045.1 hypothetical protein [Micromonospora parathelypteridis]GGO25305.1 hypothetical protein GCM10011576_47680 [Micromonospora parathelypteridis]